MSTTPNDAQRPTRQRSTSRTRIPSRPTTPLRPSSRTSLRNSQQASTSAQFDPISALEGQFAEFSDAMADLEANFMHLQLMHESLSRFSESFAAFLYGLNMNAFCIDFTEVRGDRTCSYRRANGKQGPIAESFKRAHLLPTAGAGSIGQSVEPEIDATFLYSNPHQSTLKRQTNWKLEPPTRLSSRTHPLLRKSPPNSQLRHRRQKRQEEELLAAAQPLDEDVLAESLEARQEGEDVGEE